MVHPDFRRQGIARALMAEVERLASELERSLITLDTRTGDAAEPLYASMGYRTVGIVPGYCLDPFDAEAQLDHDHVQGALKRGPGAYRYVPINVRRIDHCPGPCAAAKSNPAVKVK